jgi:hypothetical protein
MSHTLHRIKRPSGQDKDFVVLVMPARKKNNTDVVARYGQYIDIFKKYNPVNIGGMKIGLLIDHTADELKKLAEDEAPMIHAVYETREDLTGVLRELKDKDLGFSVVVSGLLDDVRKSTHEAGLTPHSYHFSLGVWGNKPKLPPAPLLEITTMCGHSMISAGLVAKMVKDIKKGKKTARKAAEQLTRPCMCGIFNTDKAEALLTELAQA